MRTYPWRLHIVCALPLLLVLAALRICIGSEREVALFFAQFRPGAQELTWVLTLVTDYGNYVLYTMYVGLLVWGMRSGDKNRVNLAVSFIVAFAVVLLTVYFLKAFVGRARPYMEPGFTRWIWIYDHHSFPSGHTTEALMSVLPVAMYWRKYRVAFALGCVAALIAFTRAYLSVHYLSDILGGMAMGSIGALLTWALYVERTKKTGG